MRSKSLGRTTGPVFAVLHGILAACNSPADPHGDAQSRATDADFHRDNNLSLLDAGADAPDVLSVTTGASADASPVVPCFVQAPTACPDPAPHYTDVSPVFQRRCVANCHSGVAGGPWPLADYEHVSDWRDAVRDELLHCLMPPPDSGVPIEDQERLAILTWIRCGLPE